MTMRRYLLVVILPSLALSVTILYIALSFEIPGFQYSNQILILSALFIPVTGIIYPYLQRQQKAQKSREIFYLFITHLTSLSISNVDRVEVFRQIASDEQYGPLAEEMRRLVVFVDTFNQSLDESCIVLSKRTHSTVLSQFLERMAHNLSSGQELSSFLTNEQDQIIENYMTKYRADIDRIEVFTNTYLSTMLALTFFLIFSVISPLIVGIDPVLTLSIVILLFIIAQFLFSVVVHTISPEDFLLYQPSYSESKIARKQLYSTVISFIAVFVIALMIMLISLGYLFPFYLPPFIPQPIYIAIPSTPLFFGGLYIKIIESKVMARDEQYPGFIRGLGSSEAIRQSSTASVLRGLKEKDFGNLNIQIEKLYRRLKSRTDDTLSWSKFSVESGSYLIWKFSDMYREARSFGANTKELGIIISKNFNEVLKIREKRKQVTETLRGLLYGLVATSSFAMFATIEIVEQIIRTLSTIDTTQATSDFLNPGIYELEPMLAIVVFGSISTSVVSSIIIRISKRRSISGCIYHISILIWVSMIAASLAFMGGEMISVS
jgi:flagellar protein FlaJ